MSFPESYINLYKADLHIHTTLSPCGDIEMTPLEIVKLAKAKGLDIIGITDHNSTLQSREIQKIGEREGLYVLCGAEVTTKEEVHVVVLVNGDENLNSLQNYLQENLIKVPNNPEIFGYQLVVDELEDVLYQEDNLLIGSIDRSIEEVEEFVHSLGGIFIPAHIDKQQNSLISQLGFVPLHLAVDALELSYRVSKDEFLKSNPYLKNYPFITSSDAHYPKEIGRSFTNLEMAEISFENIKNALKR